MSALRWITLAAVIGLRVDSARGAEPINFTRDILPIISDHCFACHGPDEKSRKAELRLDTKDGLSRVTGKPDASELLDRIQSTEPGKLMPPKKFNKPLKPEQIAKLKLWVDQGANWTQHWAFIPPRRVRTATGQKPIDDWIRENLKRQGLSMSPEAPKTTWLRRVTFDLTGLPPTPDEIRAFLADTTPNAYEKVADRLLSSPRYGEHQARIWLDLARFGDTHGLHLDNYREMWLYRDWVIRAFNDNKPYDQFLIEQLAGDLLPNATTEQKIGTGFLRCGITTSEGGVIEEECYVRNVVDNVDTVGSVFLGLTVGCARCHDHKYDPISQKDYYSLFAYFNSIDGSALDGNAARHAPVISVPSSEQIRQMEDYRARLAAVNSRIQTEVAKVDVPMELPKGPPAPVSRKELVWIDDAIPTGASEQTDAVLNRKWNFVFKTELEPYAGEKCVKLDAKGLMQVVAVNAKPGLRVGEGDKLFTYVWIDPKNPPKQIMIQWHTTNWLHRAYWGENRIDWGKDRTTERRSFGQLPDAGKWVKLEVAASAVGINPGSTITGIAFTQFDGTAYWDRSGLLTATPQGDRRFETFPEWISASANDTAIPTSIRDIIKLKPEQRSPAQTLQLRRYFVEYGLASTRAIFEPLHSERNKLTGLLTQLENEIPATYVFKERAIPRPAFILKRGEYDQRGDAVSRATPQVLTNASTEIPKDRLGLARWLVSSNHPLTARVAVNRFWQQLFGVGLVKTADDFGTQGEPPIHPELLDMLALDFQETGWNVKQLLKSMVLSATYRQSSKCSPELLAKDPQNRWLARGPRFRLDAEMIRDQALFASGLLSESIGGPSVKPPQPAGLWEAVGYTSSNTARFQADTGAEKVFRRSLYTFWKRTAPPPQMTALDAPSREACTVRRERTNTPLQALLLMNETQFVEAARVSASRALTRGVENPIAFLFLTIVSRPPSESESHILSRAHQEFATAFAKDPEAARKLIMLGETKPEPKLDPVQLAAMTLVANTILNLDEALSK